MCEVKDSVKGEDLVERKEAHSERTTVFEVKAKALHNMQAPGIYHKDPRVEGLQHISVSDCAVHCWWNGLPSVEMLDRVDYMDRWLGCSNWAPWVYKRG